MQWMFRSGLVLCATAAAAQPASVHTYLKLFDSDHDGRVSQAEYVRYMSRGFDAMDVNHDGILEAAEVPPSPRQRGPMTRQAHRRNLIATFKRQDLDHDGYLSAAELAEPPH